MLQIILQSFLVGYAIQPDLESGYKVLGGFVGFLFFLGLLDLVRLSFLGWFWGFLGFVRLVWKIYLKIYIKQGK